MKASEGMLFLREFFYLVYMEEIYIYKLGLNLLLIFFKEIGYNGYVFI